MSKYPDTTNTRVFSIKNMAGPENAPKYQGCMKASSILKPKGEPTIITCPDPNKYGRFKVVAKSPGEEGLPEMMITARYVDDLSDLLAFLNRGCDVDLQIHVGRCANPQDFTEGWEKILVLEAAQPGDYAVADLGALEQGDQSPVLEEMPFRGERLYEITKMAFEEQAEDEAVQEILAIVACDAIECGGCDNPSDGCEKVFAITVTVGGSPGAIAELIFTGNGGALWEDTEIDTLAVDQEPTDLACVGLNVVVISNDEDAHHYAPKADILEGTETWTKVTGYNANGSPNAILSLSPVHTWVVGDGGYVYFFEDPTITLTASDIQTAGTVTTEDLQAIHGWDLVNLVAVGNNNALIVTRNGGDTWTSVTGPNAGVNLTAVWMRGPDEWWVGCADGTLWYTIDAGLNWTQRTLPGQANLTQVDDIKFSTSTVGWLAVRTATAGRILRSIDGGFSWYVAPEGNLSLPANDYLNEIAVCPEDPNTVYAGGLADDGTDGIIVKGS